MTEVITASKEALHEKLTRFFAQLQNEMSEGELTVAQFAEHDPAFLADNLIFRLTHSGDGRIHTMDV